MKEGKETNRMQRNQHVVPHKGGWAVRAAGAGKITLQTKTQSEAIDAAREISRKQGCELLIHSRQGTIRDKISSSQHVVATGDGSWAVRKFGATKASKTFGKRSDAIKHARDIAKGDRGELYIHSRDGAIREKNSYGADVHPPRG